MPGMIVDAARVDCAYTEGAYVDLKSLLPNVEVDGVARCPFVHGWLGRREGGKRSKPNFADELVAAPLLPVGGAALTEELLLDETSKCPERFSRKLACSANAESLRDMGVVGFGGGKVDMYIFLNEVTTAFAFSH